MPVVVQFERQRQQRLQPDDAAGRRAERQALQILVPRRVVAGDRVDRAVAQTLDDGAPVALAAQRRRQFREGPVIADRGLVQREIGRGGIAGDRQPGRLGLADRVDRRLGRDMRDVIARAGDRDEAQIALDHDHFGHRRDRRQAEPRRDLALGDLAGGGEARLLRVLDDELVEAAGIGQAGAA